MRLRSLLLALVSTASCAHAAPTPVVTIAPRAPVLAETHASRVTEAPPPPERHAAPPAPTVFVMRTASERFDFRLEMRDACPADVDTCTGPALLRVLEKSGAEVWRTDLESVWVNLDEHGEPLVDQAELYELQGTVIVGDFDFDGREDLAVQVDQNGPYGGPTFSVFLETKSGSFARSPALSHLTEETLGFFEVLPKEKRLRTLAKSGCCYHVVEDHEVVRGDPRVVHRVTEDALTQEGFVVRTDERLVAGRWRRTVRRVAEPR